MTKTLNDFLEVYKPKSPDEQKFVDKHVTIKHKDRNGNGDDVFNGNTKTIKRKEGRHGYDVGEDEKVYEEVEELDEDTAGDVVRANHRIMQHQQHLKNIMNSDMGNPFQKIIQIRDAKKHLASLHADRQNAIAKYEEEIKKSKVKPRKKKVSEEVDLGEAVTVNKKNYSWGKMITVHQGSATSFPLHPEHQEKIRKLSDGDKTSFKDETGATVHAHRSGDTVHLKKPGSSNRVTSVAHSHFTEEVDIDTVLDEALDLLMSIDEKTLTPAEMKKREEVVKAIKRDDPKMDKSMAYAIATKTAKRVAEGTMPSADEPTDADKRTAQKIRDLLAREKKLVKRPTNEETIDEATVDPAKMSGARYAPHFTTADDVSKNKDGTHTFRRGFFYRSGRTSEGFAKNVSDDLNRAGIEHEVVKHGTQDYKPFRGGASVRTQNHHHVTVRIKPNQKVRLEESEQLDELSPKTLQSYDKKADVNFYKTNTELKKRYHNGFDPDLLRQSNNRRQGMKLAGNKLMGRAKVPATGVSSRVTKEDTQIDELSKKTLGSYIKKNRSSVEKIRDKQMDVLTGNEKDDQERRRVRNLPKMYTNFDYDRVKDSPDWKDLERKKTNRDAGRKLASAKIKPPAVRVHATEDTQIDELSKNTLGSYISKATNQAFGKGYTGGSMKARGIITRDSEEENAGEKNIRKGVKRIDGVNKAVRKLTKEDIINRTIEKYVPEDIKFTPEERLLKRIDGLSEGHIDTLLGLFEALNIDNQNKMIRTVESREGINQLLNFALENKGE